MNIHLNLHVKKSVHLKLQMNLYMKVFIIWSIAWSFRWTLFLTWRFREGSEKSSGKSSRWLGSYLNIVGEIFKAYLSLANCNFVISNTTGFNTALMQCDQNFEHRQYVQQLATFSIWNIGPLTGVQIYWPINFSRSAKPLVLVIFNENLYFPRRTLNSLHRYLVTFTCKYINFQDASY